MQKLAKVWKVSAFKLYPMGGPDGQGHWLDDPVRGLPIFEEARRVGLPIVAVHKGLPLPFTAGGHGRAAAELGEKDLPRKAAALAVREVEHLSRRADAVNAREDFR